MNNAFAILAAFFLFIGTLTAEAKRVALVIGNSSYEHAAPLENPKNDAEDMAAKLEGLDFEVVRGLDLDLSDMRETVRDFVGKLEGADMALFFYAGHGLQVNGENYMAPIDAKLASHIDLDFETMPINLIMSAMESSAAVNLVFLDACRDNPLAQNLARSMGTRSGSVGRGLARLGSGVGSLIAFSTQPGNVALDGVGRNSPFTAALLENLGTPGQDITRELIQVRRAVLEATDGKQVPWDNSSLTGDVILRPLDTAPSTSSGADAQFELTYWNSIKDANSKIYFDAYLQRYPEGVFADIAKLKIAELATATKNAEVSDRQTNENPAGGEIEAETTQRLASLGQSESVAEKPPVDPKADRQLVRSIQEELNRTGCSAGQPDGVWGRNTERGLSDFARHSGDAVASLDPSSDLLRKLRSSKKQVCPTDSQLTRLDGFWVIERIASGPCGWKSHQNNVQITQGVISGSSNWKGTVSEQGRIKLKHYFVIEGRNESNSLNGTMDGDGGSGIFQHDQGNCRGKFTISRR